MNTDELDRCPRHRHRGRAPSVREALETAIEEHAPEGARRRRASTPAGAPAHAGLAGHHPTGSAPRAPAGLAGAGRSPACQRRQAGRPGCASTGKRCRPTCRADSPPRGEQVERMRETR